MVFTIGDGDRNVTYNSKKLEKKVNEFIQDKRDIISIKYTKNLVSAIIHYRD